MWFALFVNQTPYPSPVSPILLLFCVGSTDQYLATCTRPLDRAAGALHGNIYISAQLSIPPPTLLSSFFSVFRFGERKKSEFVHRTERSFVFLFWRNDKKITVRSLDFGRIADDEVRFVYLPPKDKATTRTIQ